MQATTERTLGQYGTVEEAYQYKAGKPYNHATKPKFIEPTSVTAQGSAPTVATRAKRASIDAQHARNMKPARRARGGKARWVEFVGLTYDHKYGIKVKVTGISTDTYWLPYDLAYNLWYEVSGTDLQDYVGE